MARKMARGRIRVSPALNRAIKLAEGAILSKDGGGGTSAGTGGAPIVGSDVFNDTYGGGSAQDRKRREKKSVPTESQAMRERGTRGGAGGMA